MKHIKPIAACFLLPGVVFFVHLIASKGLGLYQLYPHLDIPAHYLGGISIAYALAKLVQYLEAEEILRPVDRRILLVLLISLTASAAVFWEFGEFIGDRLFQTNIQISLANTMQDQFFGILGGTTVALLTYRKDWRKA